MNTLVRSAMLLASAAVASYVEPPFPGPTNAQEHFAMLVQGAMPAPTEAPVLRFDWFKRQTSLISTDESAASASGTDAVGTDSSSGSQIGWLAPDNTCGYIGGRFGAALTCSTTEYCAAATITGSGKMACCQAQTNGICTFFETCIDYQQYYSSSACDHACLEDINTMKCLSSAFPYCFPYTVPGVGALYYSCDAFTTTVPQDLLTTFNGETDGRTWTPVYNTSLTSASILTNTNPVTATGTGSNGQTSTGAGLAPANTGSTTTSSPTPSPTPAPQGKSSTPVGAIVGGVVGGLAVIAIAAAAITYFCLKGRRKQSATGPLEAQQPAMAAAPAAAAAPPAQYDYKQPDAMQSPIPPRYSHIETGQQPANTAELSGDYHQPVFNAQGVQAHELGPGPQAMH